MNTAYQFQEWILSYATDLQVALFFVLFATLALAEIVAPARKERAETSRRWFTNLLLSGLNIGLMGLIPVSFFSASIWAARNGVGLLNLMPLPFLGLLVSGVLLRGLISFLTHFLMHRIPFFWRVHRVHHLDTEMDVSTTVRFHPVELVLNLVPGLVLVLAFGLPPWVLLFYEVLDAGITVFSHANIRLPVSVERWLHFLIVTPDLHRIHHSSHQPETDSNFGAVLPVWDMIFRTFRTKTREPQNLMPLGLDEVRDDRSSRVGWLLASPMHASLTPKKVEQASIHEAI